MHVCADPLPPVPMSPPAPPPPPPGAAQPASAPTSKQARAGGRAFMRASLDQIGSARKALTFVDRSCHVNRTRLPAAIDGRRRKFAKAGRLTADGRDQAFRRAITLLNNRDLTMGCTPRSGS